MDKVAAEISERIARDLVRTGAGSDMSKIGKDLSDARKMMVKISAMSNKSVDSAMEFGAPIGVVSSLSRVNRSVIETIELIDKSIKNIKRA